MKKIISTVLLSLILTMVHAQTPEAINYQVVARDGSGNLLTSQSVRFRLSILQGSPSGTVVYSESYLNTTNSFGLADIKIGQGTVISGTFSAIDWEGSTYYLKTEMDPAGGTAYQLMGTTQFLAVPYSLYSKKAGNVPWTITGNNQYSAVLGNVGIGTTTPNQKLTVDGSSALWNNNKYQLYSNSGTTLKAYLGSGYNNDLTLKNAISGWLRIGNNNAPICFWTNNNVDVDSNPQMVFDASGKLGIGTVSPDQKLSAIGVIRGSSDAAETEYVEISHNGSNGYINWAGDGNLEFRYNGTALASVIQTGGFNITSGNAYMIGGNNMLNNEGANNIFVGYEAGLGNSAINATFMGYQAGKSSNSGNYNTFIGCKSGQQNTSGSDNTFIGDESGQHNTIGADNVMLGAAAGDGNTTGSSNVFIGHFTGGTNATGTNNVMVGTYAGYNCANQTGNIFLGYNAGRNETVSNKLYIDNSNTGNPLIWGDFSTDEVKINGSLYVTTLPLGDKKNVQWDDVTGQFYYDNSSRRHKENITTLSDDCSKLLSVSPKTYTRPNNPGVWEIGYIAEEFDAAGLNKLVWYGQDGKPEGINYDKIILYTNENVKRDHQRIEELEKEIESLKNQLQTLTHKD